jgi:hypothetical protein
LRLRGIAVLQALGALLGVYALLADLSLAPLEVFSCVPLSALVLVIWFAVGVWRGDPRAIRAMQWVLLAQVPWLNLAKLNLHYDFYFLFGCTVRLGNASEPLELGGGTAFNAYLGSTSDSAYFGVNLAAVGLFLIFRSARRSWLGLSNTSSI